MKTKRTPQGFAKGVDAIAQLEGMEVEFDEKVTLFPVDLEEIRNVAPRSASRMTRGGKPLH